MTEQLAVHLEQAARESDEGSAHPAVPTSLTASPNREVPPRRNDLALS
jgi:hypothetical protein